MASLALGLMLTWGAPGRGDTFYLRFDVGGQVTNFLAYYWTPQERAASIRARRFATGTSACTVMPGSRM